MATILIYLSLALIAVTLVIILVFGAKNAGARLQGESKMVLFAFALPVILLGVMYAVSGGDAAATFVYTAVVLTVLGLIALLVSGAKGLFS